MRTKNKPAVLGKPKKAPASARRTPKKRARQVIPSALQLRSILVPMDFSAESEKALTYAVPLAGLFDAKLTLVHVIEPLATPDFVGAFPLALENEKADQESRRHLQRIVDALKLEPSLIEKLLVRRGRAFNEITSVARSLKADLIVISTHGRTGLTHALLGSTAERVVQHAPCPVLVVRPNEREFLRPKRSFEEVR
jgi:universal stress protein A